MNIMFALVAGGAFVIAIIITDDELKRWDFFLARPFLRFIIVCVVRLTCCVCLTDCAILDISIFYWNFYYFSGRNFVEIGN